MGALALGGSAQSTLVLVGSSQPCNSSRYSDRGSESIDTGVQSPTGALVRFDLRGMSFDISFPAIDWFSF